MMMTTDYKKADSPTLGLYLHIPFCVAKCHYCDFYSAPTDPQMQARYVAALVRDLIATAPKAHGYTVDTVYIGGGTPTLLSGESLALLLDTVRGHYTPASGAEITVECNPTTLTDGLFERLVTAGVNRLSIGLQSANDRELRALGRPHNFDAFVGTYRAARAAGIKNINVDLMFGIPYQTKETLQQTLDAVLCLAPQHISAYGLRVEEGTRFFAQRGSLPIADDDTVADMQEQIAAVLARAGYLHYEVSNYARQGYRSRHNMRYWLGAPYLGFGPAAHSYFEGVRTAISPDTGAYISALEQGNPPLVCERHEIGAHEAREEYVMLRMRLLEGIDEADFLARFGVEFEKTYGPLDQLLKGGLLSRVGGRIAFTERGMYVSNAILSDWLDFER
ncbi:MAG: radical SAM family heme chaperone HemW [Clostridia bacterium]|nr:radical SAM family heme chaperone HemW [Clostridia bacterium]